ncbi:MAG: MBL fold metallo-hydrolase [Candidatus Thorarchaeota archaeon]|nr:MAG: MBL fold metallo-hydrolase [Candidatus Thorarchaeota archaeon]
MFEIEAFDDKVTCVKTATEMAGNAIMWVYSYLIDKTLIDAGCGNAKEELWAYAREVGVDRVYVTHTHEDHVGTCALLSQQATIFARENQIPILKDPPEKNEFFAYVWGSIPPVSKIEVMPDDFSVGDMTFEVITLPGHSPDLMVGFYEKDRGWLFSSDAVPLPSRKRIAMDCENVVQIVSTMEKILDLNLEVLFDAHRGPVVDPQDYIQTRIDFLKDVRRESKALHDKGRTIDEIVSHFSFEAPWYMEMTEGRFSIEHLIESLIFDEP